MKPILWKPEYSIHDERVDSQHRKLFEIYNQLCAEPLGTADQEKVIHELYRYAVFHFAEEEALMATANYPKEELARHQKSHQSFFHTLERLRAESFDTSMAFFREWLLHHILTEDKRVGVFLESELR